MEQKPGQENPAAGPNTENVLAQVAETLQRLNARIDDIQAQVQAYAEQAYQTPPAAPAPLPEITDEQLNTALAGDAPATAVRTLVQREIERIRQQEIEPLKQVGLGALHDLARRSAVPEMRFYGRFQKEIDAYVSRLDPALRSRPETWKVAHDAVVGMHHDELAREAVEEAIRKAREPQDDGGKGHGGQAVAEAADEKPATFEALVGADAMLLLKQRGISPDEYARRLGYKDATDFVAKANEVV